MLSQVTLKHALTKTHRIASDKQLLEDPSHAMTMYAVMHRSTFSLLTTDVALTWRQCCSNVK